MKEIRLSGIIVKASKEKTYDELFVVLKDNSSKSLKSLNVNNDDEVKIINKHPYYNNYFFNKSDKIIFAGDFISCTVNQKMETTKVPFIKIQMDQKSIKNYFKQSNKSKLIEHLEKIDVVNLNNTCILHDDKLSDFWMKRFIVRQFRLVGLEMKHITEIKSNKISFNDALDALFVNPYRFFFFQYEFCKDITRKIGDRYISADKMDEENKKARDDAVAIYKNYCDSKYSYTNLNNLHSKASDLQKFFIVVDHKKAYTPLSYFVEVNLAILLAECITSSCDEVNYVYNNTLSEIQNKAVKTSLENPITIILGNAGTGKSTLIKKLHDIFDEKEIPHQIVSFTGKSVAKLNDLQCNAVTIHRYISQRLNVPYIEYLIVDEISMVSNALFYDLINYYKSKFNKLPKLILVGDPNQLEPIRDVPVIDSLLKFNNMSDEIKIPVIKLEQYYRPNDKIIQYLDAYLHGTFHEGLNVIEGGILELDELIKSKFKDNKDNFTIICPKNSDVIVVNELCQNIFIDEKEPGFEFTYKYYDKFVGHTVMFKVGDKVMNVKNIYNSGVMNGQEGKITKITEFTIEVTFNNGLIANYPKSNDFRKSYDKNKYYEQLKSPHLTSDFDTIDKLTLEYLIHSYAITCHKSQGSEWENIVVYCPYEHQMITKKLIYTAMSRAKSEIYLVGNRETFVESVNSVFEYKNCSLAERILENLED